MSITKYKEFLLEKEFHGIITELLLITEGDNLSAGETIEWDINKGIPDEPAEEVEWSFDKKSKTAGDRVKGFVDWLNRGDEESGLGIKHPIITKIEKFLDKVKNPQKIKEYFIRIIDEIKSMPSNLKKKLLKNLCVTMAIYIPLSTLLTPDVIKKEPLLAEIKVDITNKNVDKNTKEISKPKEIVKFASFDDAQKLVKTAEAGYSDDRADTGNWIKVSGGQRFIGTNHGISAPVLVQYFKDKGIDRLPTKQDMIELEYETAKEIYKKDYWDLAGLSNFKSQSIANVLYDECVNQGVGAALSDIKKSMQNMGHKIDDIVSWKEFHKELTPKVNNMSNKQTRKLFQIIKDVRLERYERAETWDDHGVGWTKRINAIAFEDDNTKDSDFS
jgi:lysozyme family protein